MANVEQAVLVGHNLHGGGEKDRNVRRLIIDKFLNASAGGLGGFNELHRGDRRYLKKQAKRRKMKVFYAGKDGAVWDASKFRLRKKRVKKIMTGGYVGADGSSTARRGDDDRRVGPNRYCIYLEMLSPNSVIFEFDITHLIAKSFTSYPWRRFLFRSSVKSLASGIRAKNGVLFGDMNSKDYIDLPGIKETVEKTPPTLGKQRYDQFIHWGKQVEIAKVKDVETPSDHDMLLSIVKFYQSPRG